MAISIEYPLWFLLLCPVTGVVFAIALYYRDRRTAEFHLVIKWLMSISRFTLITLLVFLLFSPLIKSNNYIKEKPIVVIAEDNSLSIVSGKDSGFYKSEYRKKWNNVINELNQKYDVRLFSFGSEIKESMDYAFNEKETDISSLFSIIAQRYYGKNLGALILATDGIYNKGFDPLYTSHELKCLIYTVALGDTLVRRDAIITNVEHNNTVFLGNSFPLQVLIDAKKLEGKSTTLTVNEVNGKSEKNLYGKSIAFTSTSFHSNVPIELSSTGAGLKHYIVRISPVEGEENLQNNRRDVYIHVLDQKQHVLIISNPHPDVGAIAESINSSDGFEAETSVPDKLIDKMNKYCLVILNQFPSANNKISDVLNSIKQLNIPVLYIVGSETDLTSFNTLNVGLKILSNENRSSDAEAIAAPGFSLFVLDNAFLNYIPHLPALSVPFGNYMVGPTANILFNQKIQGITTNYPLIIFNETGTEKSCVICGEGIFRWKLQDYADHKNHQIFDELINKIVQYLAVKEDKSFFRVHVPTVFKEDEHIIMDAELYNPSYQLINEPEVNAVITDDNGRKYSFTFSRTSNSYHLDAGTLQAENYKYETTVNAAGKLFTREGEFTVTPIQIEAVNTIAEHHILFQIASEHKGKMLFPNQIEELPEIINKRDDLKPVIYTHVSFSRLIGLKWVIVTLLTIISIEWFVRKWNGIY